MRNLLPQLLQVICDVLKQLSFLIFFSSAIIRIFAHHLLFLSFVFFLYISCRVRVFGTVGHHLCVFRVGKFTTDQVFLLSRERPVTLAKFLKLIHVPDALICEIPDLFNI